MSDEPTPDPTEIPPEALDAIDRICDRFEAGWNQGKRPRVEDYLGELDPAFRHALLCDLLAAELDARRRRGERSEPREYHDRFPGDASIVEAAFTTMPNRPSRAPPGGAVRPDTARDLLFGLLALQNGLIGKDQLVAAFRASAREKARPLAEHLVARGELDAEQRMAVEGLVELHLKKHGGDPEQSLVCIPAGRSTLERLARIGDPEIGATLAHLATSSRPSEPGEHDVDRTESYVVGSATSDGLRFRVLRPHARGGLGAVFVAMDEELHREVALKQILEQHADDPVSRSRFLVEAEITGGLEHPGIVPVYGLGTYGDGRPYYAMRFIKGDSLKDAIERFHGDRSLRQNSGGRSVELRKLLRRFLDVCNAIEYAHSRGVLHRDLKPGNVIVGKYGETLVIDWGLAKALGSTARRAESEERPLTPPSASGSAQTMPGGALGTPAYMSPEQAEGALDRLGPRSDVYSLGATLYCLLTGKAPFEGDDIGVMLSSVQKGTFPRPRAVDPTIDKALEAICVKAMAHQPQDRYASPRILAEEIERWMADEPVAAYPEPWGIRASRWSRRHRTAVVSAVCLLIASVIGLSIGLVLLRAKQRETDIARKEAVENYLGAVVARKAADSARADAQANFARALDAVETMLVRVSQKELVNLPHFERVRIQLLNDALSFYQGFLARAGDAPDLLLQASRAHRSASDIHRQFGQRELAGQDLERALNLLDRLPDGAERVLEQAAVHHARAQIDIDERRRPEGIAELRRALALLLPIRNTPMEPQALRALLVRESASQSTLAYQLSFANRFAEAREVFSQARASLERLLDHEPRNEPFRAQLSALEHNEAVLDVLQRDDLAAVQHLSRAVHLQEELLKSAPNAVQYRRDQANSSNQLACSLGRLGRFPEAVEASRRAIAIFSELTADYPSVSEYRFFLASAHHNLANNLSWNGRRAAAREEFLRAIEVMEVLTRREPENPAYLRDLANTYMWLGSVDMGLRKLDESVQELTRARDLFAGAARLRPGELEYHFSIAAAEHNRAEALERAGRLHLAEMGYLQSQKILAELIARAPDNALYAHDLANSTIWLARCLQARHESARATVELDRALVLLDGLLARSPRDPTYIEQRAQALILLGRLDEAVRSCESLARSENSGSQGLYQAACVLAFNLPRPGRDPFADARVRPDRAKPLADRAMDFLSQAVARGYPDREQFESDDELEALRSRVDFRPLLNVLFDHEFPTNPFAP
jgi:serine/threonine-protein kinase